VVLSNAAAVVLQASTIEGGLSLERGSLAFLQERSAETIRVSGRSRLETWGQAEDVAVKPGSRWSDHGERRVRLENVPAGPVELELVLRARPGSTWRGYLAPLLGFTELRGSGMPVLLDPAALRPLGGPRLVGVDGVDVLRVPRPSEAELRGAPLYFQALVRDPAEAELVLSGVCGTHVSP
jgi:hypothetical protein